MNSRYIEWLKEQHVRLFEGGGTLWRTDQGALIPAHASPCFIVMNENEGRSLLRESGAWFLRYSSVPSEVETEWWYTVCDFYNPDTFSSKIRSMIKRGNRSCSVGRVDAAWLARFGYECYRASYSRYKNARPLTEDGFRDGILRSAGGPFEYWGVFVNDALAGFCQCIVENNNVATSSIKYHPAYLQYYTSYALVTGLINHYVTDHGMTISNGTRSIAHDTNFQDFLLKLGFRRQFCHLRVVYQPWLKAVVQSVFPLCKVLARLPDRGPAHKLRALLFQEQLRRACATL